MDFTVGIFLQNLASMSTFVEFRDSHNLHVFEASRFGGRKTIFDVKKVTYNTYSCVISGMNREIMKMDGRDSVECQNWEKKGQNSHFEFD